MPDPKQRQRNAVRRAFEKAVDRRPRKPPYEDSPGGPPRIGGDEMQPLLEKQRSLYRYGPQYNRNPKKGKTRAVPIDPPPAGGVVTSHNQPGGYNQGRGRYS